MWTAWYRSAPPLHQPPLLREEKTAITLATVSGYGRLSAAGPTSLSAAGPTRTFIHFVTEHET